MEVFYQKSTVAHKLRLLKSNSKKVAFVPTMGALHAGHISLVSKAKNIADIVVVSIFVNKAQFNESSDFQNYPKDQQNDMKLLQEAGVDVVFMPDDQEVYNDNFSCFVSEEKYSKGLCGETRKGHFTGVCTIVTKLFNIISPDIALFGEKDYQQYAIVKKMVSDLDMNVEVVSGSTMREDSGLAMSSRNRRLSELAREKVAPLLFKNMSLFAKEFTLNPRDYNNIKQEFCQKLLQSGFDKIDYLTIYNCRDFSEYNEQDKIDSMQDFRVFAAVFLEDVRLIDNVPVC